MKVIGEVPEAKVILYWLVSELYRLKGELTVDQINIIKYPDLENVEQNTLRKELLYDKFGSSAILDSVPKNINWHEVEIEEVDIEKIYLLAIWDWFLDTGKTYKLSDIPTHLSSPHGHRVTNFPPPLDHKKKIEEMSNSLQGEIADIVMIATNTDAGPFTVIDGTHRSSLLAIRGQLPGTKAYLGISPDLTQCVWPPEWDNYQRSLDELNKLVDDGYLW